MPFLRSANEANVRASISDSQLQLSSHQITGAQQLSGSGHSAVKTNENSAAKNNEECRTGSPTNHKAVVETEERCISEAAGSLEHTATAENDFCENFAKKTVQKRESSSDAVAEIAAGSSADDTAEINEDFKINSSKE